MHWIEINIQLQEPTILALSFHSVLCDALGCCLACLDFARIRKVRY